MIEPETAVKPVETKAEIALVAPTLVIKQMTPAALDKPNAKGDKPNEVDTDGEHKAGNAVSIIEMSGFKVETMTFEIAVEFFGPHANSVETEQSPVIGAIGEEKPGLPSPVAQ
ncbi:MAG: hypothetical protein R2932_58815 [Caldilineaceae bacterium]